MPSTRHARKETLHSLADLPAFASEAEEAAFWDSHELSEEILEQMRPLPEGVLPPPRGEDVTVAVPLDPAAAHRLRALAEQRHVSPEALARDFLRERLAVEGRRKKAKEHAHG